MCEPNTALKAGPGQDIRWNTYGVGARIAGDLPADCPSIPHRPHQPRVLVRGDPYPPTAAPHTASHGTPTALLTASGRR